MPEPELLNNNDLSDDLSVNIRMYCHGLGDCFLLTFQKNERKFSMLIDCGILQRTQDEKRRMEYVAKNILEKTDGTLDLVVVTHEHHDHICGFSHAAETFDKIIFKEIWLAWTEDPDNELAKSLGLSKLKSLVGLSDALFQMRQFGLSSAGKVESLLMNFSGDAIDEAKKNRRSKGLEYILTKNKPDSVQPKYTYCYPGKKPLLLEGFEKEVRVYVLGPPHDKSKLRDLSAPSVEKYRHHFAEMLINDGYSMDESFFFALDQDSDALPQSSPFDEGVGISKNDVKKESFFENNYYDPENDWRTIDGDWLSITGELALKMDSYTNNTSLVLAIELIKSGKVLLFAADAQFGNWKSWHDHSWLIKQTDGTVRKIKTADLLANTVVYKVGHHGSHNATLRQSGLELMTHPELVALIPVDTERAKKEEWQMPFSSLLEDLQIKTKGRVIAADKELLSDEQQTDRRNFKIDEENKLFEGDPRKKAKLFIDYEIKG